MHTGDKISNITLQFAMQKWPSCYVSFKCIVTSCDSFYLPIMTDCLYLRQYNITQQASNAPSLISLLYEIMELLYKAFLQSSYCIHMYI